jgi:polyphenol oxidase
MLFKEKKSIRWLEFSIFQNIPKLVHGVFLRQGGHSHGLFSSLNVSLSVGDDQELVNKNRKLIADVLHLKNLFTLSQVHSDQLHVIHSSNLTCDTLVGDGLLTKEVGIGLMTQHADCQVTFFVDPHQKVLANVHAGWRGNVLNIYAATVHLLQKEFGSRPQDLLVGISPSLGPSAAEFKNYEKEFPPSFASYQVRPYYFDLWQLARQQLLEAGILDSHIEIAKLCTFSNPELFFSYRREKIGGRNGSVLGWLP